MIPDLTIFILWIIFFSSSQLPFGTMNMFRIDTCIYLLIASNTYDGGMKSVCNAFTWHSSVHASFHSFECICWISKIGFNSIIYNCPATYCCRFFSLLFVVLFFAGLVLLYCRLACLMFINIMYFYSCLVVAHFFRLSFVCHFNFHS